MNRLEQGFYAKHKGLLIDIAIIIIILGICYMGIAIQALAYTPIWHNYSQYIPVIFLISIAVAITYWLLAYGPAPASLKKGEKE